MKYDNYAQYSRLSLRKLLKGLLSLFLVVFFIQIMKGQERTIQLSNNWQFKPALPIQLPNGTVEGQSLKEQWYPIAIPGTVHTALFKNKVIGDPFYRDNETKLQWLEKLDWIFETSFDVDSSFWGEENIELVLEGLDTYADVFFNGELILKGNNVFRTWKTNIKDLLQAKNNLLRIYFNSPIGIESLKKDDLGYELPGGSRVFTRKAQFNYGWDWGPRFVSSGILKGVFLKAWSTAKIQNLFVKQKQLNSQKANLSALLTIEAQNTIEKADLKIRVDSTDFVKTLSLEKGVNEINIDLTIENPNLWWSNGLGKANLYAIDATLTIDNKEIDKQSTKIGLRTIELIRKKDAKGESFYFELNGVPVFMKGANYIPTDIFQDRVTKERLEKNIQNAVDANMNMLRIWGGGVYENDEFYDLCDEKGILVWQDFMYACAMYPGDNAFLENIEKEAIEQVIRLRNHPCIALWCGNNENNEAWSNWGWQLQFALNPSRKNKIWSDYQLVFNSLLPNVVLHYSNTTDYWESSPSYSRYNPKSFTEGDNHYWGIWHDEEPFEKFDQKVPRFMSEYGFQSFPTWKTIEKFTLPEDRALETPVMLLHQKHPKGNQLIRTYMNRDYKKPNSFENFIYVSQLLQAEGIRVGIEAHRRNMPYCMGTLYWQLNDVWPVASWSSTDSYGNWKALHYYSKKAYNNVLISPIKEGNNLKTYIISDNLEEIPAELTVQCQDFYGAVLHEEKAIIKIKPNISLTYLNTSIARLNKGRRASDVFVHLIVKGEQSILAEKTYFLVPPKDLNLLKTSIEKQVKTTKDGFEITLKSKYFAKNVYLETNSEGFFSDNYFDLAANQPITLFFKTQDTKSNFEKSLKIKSLVDTY